MPTVRKSFFRNIEGEKIQKLSLLRNSILQIHQGALKRFTKLTELNLYENKLTGLFNDTFSNNRQISYLALDENNISEIPSQNVCLLKKLKSFNISSNRLKSAKFDDCFEDLKHLSSVAISNNPIGKIHSDDFYALKGSPISVLYLGGLDMTVLDKEIFQYLPNITYLDVQNNYIASLSEDIFKHIPRLNLLQLAKNNFTAVPCQTFNDLAFLGSLDLSENNIRNVTLGAQFKQMKSFNELDLSHNNLSWLTNDSFANLNNSSQFTSLQLYDCSLRVIEPGAFLPLSSLEILDIAKNDLDTSALEVALYGLAKTKSLSHLVVDETNLKNLNNQTFQILENSPLEFLKVQYCQIKTIPSDTFKYLRNLQYLYLQGNSITNFMPNTFQYNKQLKKLDLTYNKIFEIPDAKSVKLGNLKVLILFHNVIAAESKLTPDSFKGYDMLESLELGNNNIYTIKDNIFSPLTNLKTMRLSYNQISYISEHGFAGLEKLEELNLSHNNIRTIMANIFQHTPKLNELDLTSNTEIITTLKGDVAEFFKPLKNIKSLRLLATGLKAISYKIFYNLTELTSLSLSSNSLTALDPRLIQDQKYLQLLYLNTNNIKSISKGFLDNNSDLQQMIVSKNSFRCDCDLEWFTNWIRTSGVYVGDSNFIKCHSPKSKVGIKLENVYLERECMSLTLYYVYWSVVFCFCVVTTLAATLYRLRWYLK